MFLLGDVDVGVAVSGVIADVVDGVVGVGVVVAVGGVCVMCVVVGSGVVGCFDVVYFAMVC